VSGRQTRLKAQKNPTHAKPHGGTTIAGFEVSHHEQLATCRLLAGHSHVKNFFAELFLLTCKAGATPQRRPQRFSERIISRPAILGESARRTTAKMTDRFKVFLLKCLRQLSIDLASGMRTPHGAKRGGSQRNGTEAMGLASGCKFSVRGVFLSFSFARCTL
jgi:hypothetical protein